MSEELSATDQVRDYSLVGKETKTAIEKGLAEALWYTSPIPRKKMRELLERKDGPAIRDTIIWFTLLIGSAALVIVLWGTWWFILPYIVYSVIYGSTSDSRWHESGHGTAFKTDWMNNVLYEIASFMVFRQSTVWRWSHTRHHSDTIIRGRDPEIAVPRPPQIFKIIINFLGLKSVPSEFRKILIHSTGKIDQEVATYVPESEFGKVIWKARIFLAIILASIILSIVLVSPLPVMFVGLPSLVGAWLMPVYGLTQHAGMAENVLDHRLNCRTVYMNRIHRYLYWNMNYHIEHHMFPLVPYHALPKLHELMKDDCPPAYKSIVDAYREIIPAVLKQVKDPTYHVKRPLPTPTTIKKEADKFLGSSKDADENGLVKICPVEALSKEDVIRFDCDENTYAIYRTDRDKYYASDGICTHGNTHLADGLVIDEQIECPKHNGRFSLVDGSVQRPPVCVGLQTYPVVVQNDALYFDLSSVKETADDKRMAFKVVSNENVATFIKELVLEPGANESEKFGYKSGDYIHLEIPAHKTRFETMYVNEPFKNRWHQENTFNYFSFNHIRVRRNYSLADNPEHGDNLLKFNVRIATPPLGVNCSAGVGSSYVFNLKPGDTVYAYGPYGDFHIQDTEREMVYVGGGAGMAPLRAHISYLFETLKTERKVSFWYGVRSLRELYYADYFRELEAKHSNFTFHVALSEPLKTDQWDSHTGMIHEVLKSEFLDQLPNAEKKEYYLCGPPVMVKSVNQLLSLYNVPSDQIRYDEF